MKKFALLVVAIVLVAGALVAWGDWRYRQAEIVFDPLPKRLVVARGDTLRTVARGLRAQGVDIPDWAVSLIGRLRPDVERIQAGTYEFSGPITLERLIDRLVAGDVMQTEIRVVEGATFAQMRAALRAHPEIVQRVADLGEAELLARLGLEHQRAEGLFFPSTYRFAVGTDDLEVLRLAARTMDRELQKAWAARAPELPLKTPYELLILASLVEKETGLESDREMVAGVFVNRLRIGMMLQSDPTTIYGLGDAFDGNLTRRHLRADTPWNTYTRFGLPPTPIALPGEASLAAAANPATTEALYFVARGDGSSHFSRTLAEHNAAVRRYQLKQP